MELTYKQVFENNRKWAAGKVHSDAEFFTKLSKEQQPDYLYIGCSDSRVPAEQFMGADLGEVFVHRNVANQVDPTDRNAMSVIHFAVNQLGVKHIVVCGHYMCGGVEAAMGKREDGPMDPWFDLIRDVAKANRIELESFSRVEDRLRRLVELNVEAQCRNIQELEVVQEAILTNGAPSIHGWVFDIHTGMLIDLEI